MDGPSGATSFQFGQGQVLGMKMEINGPLDRLLASVLPHEITHTVFAHAFRCPVPRWADEGGSVLSEDDIERERHDKLVRSILNQSKQIPMRRLFSLKEYPREVMCLYAQGYSIADYLVKRGDRRSFLQFVAHGMQNGWDNAVLTYYGHRTVEELEESWLQYLRETKGRPHVQVAINPDKSPGTATGRNIVRMTVPPVQPLDDSHEGPLAKVSSATNASGINVQAPNKPASAAVMNVPAAHAPYANMPGATMAGKTVPVARGAMPTPDQVGQHFGSPAPTGQSGCVPVYPVPVANSQVPPPPAPPPALVPPYVRLGLPQYGPVPQQTPPQVPQGVSPVGFPH
jgi:hypothetical protein